MDTIPKVLGEKLAKSKFSDAESLKSAIIMILETNSGKHLCMSSVFDVLQEKFIEGSIMEKLPGNEQTLRNYIHYLESQDMINREPEHWRVYDYVFILRREHRS